MSKVTKQDVVKIAKLSRLKFSESEIEKFTTELSGIVNWIEDLNELNTDNVKPMASVEQDLPLRNDDIQHENQVNNITKNAPDSEYDFFLVPKIIE
jgi:aspartyl-tRNA(Asn)/glutamyl-tRNA(Gln) amidotransferase subunit C